MQRFKIGSVASGMGLHLHGLKQLGGVLAWAIEMDEAIAHCYTQNHNSQLYLNRVENVDPKELADIDLLTITLSCKNASTAKGANRGETKEDVQGAIASSNILRAKLPKYVMLENVWQYRNFEAFKIIQKALSDCGYYFQFYKFNLRDWGIAQSRDRLYLLAVRHGAFHSPMPPAWVDEGYREVGWYEAIKDLIPELPQTTLAPWQQKKFPELVQTCLVPDHSQRTVLVPQDKPASTVIASHQSFKALIKESVMVPDQSSTNLVPQGKPSLTVLSGHQTLKALIKRCGGGRDSDRLYHHEEPSFTIRAVGRNSDHHSRIADAVVGDKVVAVTPRACLRFFGDAETADSIWLPPTKSLANEVVGNGASWVMFKNLFKTLCRQ